MYIYKAGVIGAGLMGSGIAQVISFTGIPVVLKDVNDTFVQKGLSAARSFYETRLKKGKMSQTDVDAKMSLITGTTKYGDLSDVDLVIEAVPEDLTLKKQVFSELGKVCPEHTILATNTSALSISAIASAAKKPENVVGMHFFYPAPVMKLVEVIPALQTSQETIDAVVSFAENIRKIPIRVKECAGFLVNRLLMQYFCEATYALEEGLAAVEEIDEVMVKFGMPMGPFKLADTLGIDICYNAANVMYSSYGERLKPPHLLKELYDRKMLGIKSGAGFYVYDGRTNELKNIIPKKVIKRDELAPMRLIYPMINEAAICLEEGVATAGDIDLAMIAGTGFPQDKGGLLHYADSVGIENVLVELQRLENIYGQRFHPSPLLQRMVGANYLGVKTKKGFFSYT